MYEEKLEELDVTLSFYVVMSINFPTQHNTVLLLGADDRILFEILTKNL